MKHWKWTIIGGIAAFIIFGGGATAVAYVRGQATGKIRLVTVGAHQVEARGGAAFAKMQAAARAAGIILSITSGFRTMEKQTELWTSYQYQLKLYNEGKRSTKPAPAARPGYSNHQNGTAIDISMEGNNPSSKTYQWMAANAAHYGFSNTAGRSFDPPEFWHWEYKAAGTLAGWDDEQLDGLEGC